MCKHEQQKCENNSMLCKSILINRLLQFKWPMVVAQLEERSLPIPEESKHRQILLNIFTVNCL